MMPNRPAMHVGTSTTSWITASPPIPAHGIDCCPVTLNGCSPTVLSSSRSARKAWEPMTASSAAVSTSPSKALQRSPTKIPRIDRRLGAGSSSGGRGNRHRDNFMKGTEAELASRTRCWKCQELGHYSRDCPNRSQPSGSPKKTTFIVHKPQHQHGLSYPVTFPRPPDELPAPNLRSIRGIFVGLRCRAFEGLVDTAAEDAVMGLNYFSGSRAKALLFSHLSNSRPAVRLHVWPVLWNHEATLNMQAVTVFRLLWVPIPDSQWYPQIINVDMVFPL